MTAPLRFAFHGRVAAEDHQDSGASRDWQVAQAPTLLASTHPGAEVTAEYFDISISRRFDWTERPARLRACCATSTRTTGPGTGSC